MPHGKSIATFYGLDGPGIEFRWGPRFSATAQTDPRVHPASYTVGTGSFPEINRPERDADHPSQSSVEVRERVELHVVLLISASVACSRVNFTFIFTS